jgi:hypothetical protein
MMAENDENRAEARRIIATIDPATIDRLLQGAIDLHVHSGPSTMARSSRPQQQACAESCSRIIIIPSVRFCP